MQQAQELSYRPFVAYAALAVGVALVPVLLWRLGWILILGFAAILVAILLHVVSEPLQRWTPLPVWADLLIAGLVLLALIALGGWIFGLPAFRRILRRDEPRARRRASAA